MTDDAAATPAATPAPEPTTDPAADPAPPADQRDRMKALTDQRRLEREAAGKRREAQERRRR